MLSRPSYGFEHIDEGSGAVRASAFECGEFSVESLAARSPLKFGEYFSRINDGRTHSAQVNASTCVMQFNVMTLTNFGMTAFLQFLLLLCRETSRLVSGQP
jgi:hypothetical protein